MKRPKRWVLSLITVIVVVAFAMPAAAVSFGTNLIVNGNAEAGAGSSDGSVVAVPSWTTTSNFTVVQYGASGGFPTATDPGPADRGLNFFAGGPDNDSSSASQSIDVSGSPEIAAGAVTFTLSGFLGGFLSQADNAVLTARFIDVPSSMILGSTSIGPVTNVDRGGATGLLFRSAVGSIPAATDRIDLVLQMTRLSGTYNDGYADNLSLVLDSPLQAVPEPSTVLLLTAAGSGALVWRRRRR
jgi:hypothetical protein